MIEVKAVILTIMLIRLGLSLEDCHDTLCAFNYFDDLGFFKWKQIVFLKYHV